jgi:N-carbamoyl-L-amino-acid hydrolase
VISNAPPVACDPKLCDLIAQAAQMANASARTLVSGAGHDAAFVARIAPSAMIFVPSLGGRSHCPEEWTDPEALALGADVLLNTLLLRDRALPGTGRATLKGTHP